jgi:hypothetical protein
MRNQHAFGVARSHLALCARAARAPHMYYRTFPIVPTQQAANGAMDLFVDGVRREKLAQALIGLSVLQSATVEQVRAAMLFEQSAGRATVAEIAAMLAS